jgi:hypothetical protein
MRYLVVAALFVLSMITYSARADSPGIALLFFTVAAFGAEMIINGGSPVSFALAHLARCQ